MIQYLLASMPRSGTDWFVDNLLRANPELRYKREYFSPGRRVEYPHIINELDRVFGSDSRERYKKICIDWRDQTAELEEVFKSSWETSDLNFTKEIWLAFKLGFFVKRFDAFVLYRHRKYTFPGKSNPRITDSTYEWLYRSLCENKVYDQDVKQLIELSQCYGSSALQKQVFAHIIYSYKLLKEVLFYNVPIINYAHLIRETDPQQMLAYLRLGMPRSLLSKNLVNNIIASRNKSLLDEKLKMYEEAGVEERCTPLIKFIEINNPHVYSLLETGE